MSRVAITGLGVVSPFGFGQGAFFAGLAAGTTAVRPIASFDASRFPMNHAAEVPQARVDRTWLGAALQLDPDDPRPVQWETRGWLRDRKLAWALLAAREAWDQAGCSVPEQETALSLGLGLEQALLEDFAPILRGRKIQWEQEPEASLPPIRFRTSLDLAARAVHELLGLRGRTQVHVSACAAGALAVAHGAALIRRGRAEVVLAGAADAMVNPLGLGGMIRLGATSPRNAPDACRPFDRRRDGLALGEGAALFVLEPEERATARGAKILGFVEGWGSSQDGYRVTAPRPDGTRAAAAISRALVCAGIAAEAIGYVNAHGTGTPLNDPAEARALRTALGAWGGRVPVSSIKGAVGHLMAAAGALELAASLMPFSHGTVPGTVHHEHPDPDCPIRVLGPGRHPAEPAYVLSNSFGFGGQNAAVILGAP